jgi:hypothetical protein
MIEFDDLDKDAANKKRRNIPIKYFEKANGLSNVGGANYASARSANPTTKNWDTSTQL